MPLFRSALPSGFVEHSPLAPALDCLWSASPLDSDGDVTTRIVPDNCGDLIASFYDDGTLEEIFVVGTMTRAIEVRRATDRHLIGLRFAPGQLSNLLGIAASDLTDRRFDIKELDPKLNRHLAHLLTQSWYDLHVLQQRLVVELMPHRALPAPVALATHLLRLHRGTIGIDAVARTSGASRQHLARLFKRYVGISPKLFARVERVQSARRIYTKRRCTWSRIAAELGYADHSHFIVDHRAVYGAPPTLLGS